MFKERVKLTFFHGVQVSDPDKSLQRGPGGSQTAEPHPSGGAAYRTEQSYRLPNHSSKTDLSIVKKGPTGLDKIKNLYLVVQAGAVE